MTDGPVSPPPAGNKSLIARAQGILMKPNEEWAVIENEPATVGSIFTSYVLILAAIGPIATVIGQQVFGIAGIYKPSITFSVTTAAVGYVMGLVGIYLIAFIIDALAPSFGGTKDMVRAMKAAAYSWTAAWLAGIFQIIPQLAILGLVGLYSLYLLYLGLPRLMRVSADKAVGYVVVTVIAAIIVYAVALVLVGILVVMFVGAPVMPGIVVYR